MQVVQVKIIDLKPADYNPRKLTKDQHRDLTESIKRFGLVDPIIVNQHAGRENVVVGGHQRLKIAQEQGFEEVPVVYVDLDEEREKELNLRLNKNLGEWDWDSLANNFDVNVLKDIGFTNNDLGFMQGEGEEDNFDADAEAEKITTPESKPGEIYELGRHRLMCGSSSEFTDVERLMGGEKARLVFTDPPYNVNYKPQEGSIDPKRHTRGYGTEGIFNDNKTEEECIEFYTSILKNLYAFTTDDAPMYWWLAMNKIELSLTAFHNAGWRISQTLIWLKNYMTFSRGVDFHRMYEPCLFGWKDGKTHFRNTRIHDLKDIINLEVSDFEQLLDVWYERRDSVMSYEHPTQKPVRRAGRALRKSSEVGALVVDLFGGSGSTLIACEQLGRRCFTMELDPKYCDVIRKRYERYVTQGTSGRSE